MSQTGNMVKHRFYLLLVSVLWGVASWAQTDKVYSLPSEKVEKYRENARRAIEVHYIGLQDLVSEDEEMVIGRDAYREDFLKNNLVAESRTFTPEFLFRTKGQETLCDAEQYLLELQKEFAGLHTETLEFEVSDVNCSDRFYQPNDFSCYTIVDYTLSIVLDGKTQAQRRCRAYCLFPTAVVFTSCKLWQVQPLREGTVGTFSPVKKVGTSRPVSSPPPVEKRSDRLRAVASGPSADELLQKGVSALRRFDERKALSYLEEAAEKGSLQADVYIGSLYYNGGSEVKCNYSLAFRHFAKAAEGGDREGQYYLGMMYRRGHGCTKNLRTARMWLSRSAGQGHALAERELEHL